MGNRKCEKKIGELTFCRWTLFLAPAVLFRWASSNSAPYLNASYSIGPHCRRCSECVDWMPTAFGFGPMARRECVRRRLSSNCGRKCENRCVWMVRSMMRNRWLTGNCCAWHRCSQWWNIAPEPERSPWCHRVNLDPWDGILRVAGGHSKW